MCQSKRDGGRRCSAHLKESNKRLDAQMFRDIASRTDEDRLIGNGLNEEGVFYHEAEYAYDYTPEGKEDVYEAFSKYAEAKTHFDEAESDFKNGNLPRVDYESAKSDLIDQTNAYLNLKKDVNKRIASDIAMRRVSGFADRQREYFATPEGSRILRKKAINHLEEGRPSEKELAAMQEDYKALADKGATLDTSSEMAKLQEKMNREYLIRAVNKIEALETKGFPDYTSTVKIDDAIGSRNGEPNAMYVMTSETYHAAALRLYRRHHPEFKGSELNKEQAQEAEDRMTMNNIYEYDSSMCKSYFNNFKRGYDREVALASREVMRREIGKTNSANSTKGKNALFPWFDTEAMRDALLNGETK